MGKVLVTGIDIGHYSMKAVVLRESKEQLELMHFHELLVPEGIFADNHTLDHQNIVKKLAELKRMLPWYCRNIAAAIPDGVVNSKVVQVAQGLDGRRGVLGHVHVRHGVPRGSDAWRLARGGDGGGDGRKRRRGLGHGAIGGTAGR